MVFSCILELMIGKNRWNYLHIFQMNFCQVLILTAGLVLSTCVTSDCYRCRIYTDKIMFMFYSRDTFYSIVLELINKLIKNLFKAGCQTLCKRLNKLFKYFILRYVDTYSFTNILI